jgi:outer membrane murein-binding lipoprotein Lpp
MKKRHKYSLGAFAASVVMVAGVYTAASQLGFKLDRPAWHSEAIILAEAIQQLAKDMDARELARLRAAEDDLVLAIKRDQVAGRPADQVKLLQLRQLRRQIDDVTRLLEP